MWLSALTVMAVLSFFRCAAAQVKVTGVTGQVLDNVEAFIDTFDAGKDSPKLRIRIRNRLTQALNALGYYHPTFVFSRESEPLLVHIDPGPGTHLTAVDISVAGDARSDRDVLSFIRKHRPGVGDLLNHGQYERLKSGLGSLALEKGYFDARFVEKRLAVTPERNEAEIHLHFDSGGRYRFGPGMITGSQIDDDRVASLQPYKTGDPYEGNMLARYNQALSESGWFSSVFVEPDLTGLAESRELPVNVKVTPAARNRFETGLGYSTDVGIRGSFGWKRPWVNHLGHSLETSLSLSAPEQAVTAAYQIPLDKVLDDYYRFQYGMKKVNSRDTQSLESNLSVGWHKLLDSGWHRTFYTRYLMENYTQGLLDDVGAFLLPGLTFSRTRSRGEGLIMDGDKLDLTLEYGDPALISETRVFRVLAGTNVIRSLGKNHRGLFRINGAANVSDDFERLSPSLRFFAGGDNSIRGYGYDSISPRDESGALSGAKYLAVSSLEYQYRITGKWWGAVFADYGDAFNDRFHGKTGTGVGIRWVSPIGPIRIDFAWGLSAESGDRFRIHFSLGPEL